MENDSHLIEIVVSEKLGGKIDYNRVNKPVFDCVMKVLANDSPDSVEVRCLAYCIKVDVADCPISREELLLITKNKTTGTRHLVLLEKGIEGWTRVESPSHNVTVSTSVELKQMNSSVVEEFLKQSTFGFYDFTIASDERLTVSKEFINLVGFLKTPLSQAERLGRMTRFVAPGP
ncbi:MAG: hypothetical protein U0930_23365 [Pirellulales bacterium]